MALDTSGPIYVGGWSLGAAGDPDMIIWKYDPDGLLEIKFGPGGYVRQDRWGGPDAALDVVVTAYGRIIACGFSAAPTYPRDVAIWEVLWDGTVESTAVHDRAAGGVNDDDYARSLFTGGSGGTLFTGASQNRFGDFDLAIWNRR